MINSTESIVVICDSCRIPLSNNGESVKFKDLRQANIVMTANNWITTFKNGIYLHYCPICSTFEKA